MELLECVPNISEGRNSAVVRHIVDAATSASGVSLLHVDSGIDANRTVITLAGSPEAVEEGAWRLIRRASELIDMESYSGEHPCLGAVDVCPFVPLRASMESCINTASRLAERVGRELEIPVYLYREAVKDSRRQALSEIRRGGYSGLKERLSDPQWKPDYGPAVFRPRSGAYIVGARPILLAYNVNLNTQSREAAQEIAAMVRESGRLKRSADGKRMLSADGSYERIPGLLRNCQAIGWYMKSFGCAQVSMNLSDFQNTGLFEAYEACRAAAFQLGVEVRGSELIGLVPKDALLSAGRKAAALESPDVSGSEDEQALIAAAVSHLGLDSLSPFDSHMRVIESRLESLA